MRKNKKKNKRDADRGKSASVLDRKRFGP